MPNPARNIHIGVSDYYKNLCISAAIIGSTITISWLFVFMANGRWNIVALELILIMAAIPCWIIAARGEFSNGIMLAQLCCAIFVATFCLLFDVPNENAPRTTHVFFLCIAIVGYINYHRSPSRYQLALIALSVVGFVVFCGSNLALSFADPIPDGFRVTSSLFNAAIATGVLCGGVAAMHAQTTHSARIAHEFQAALWDEQFELFFQPQMDAARNILGAEALLRWKHPKRGYVPPAEFIPAAERAGFMPRLEKWVISDACRALSRWKEAPATRDLTLSINVTASQFAQPAFAQFIETTVSSHGLRPEQIKLELTENVLVTDFEAIIARMKTLRAAGFCISLDDFGTGYSSLSYLRQLPLNQIKIDRSFVRSVAESPRAAAIARGIVQLGQDLNLDMLAEGIETAEQLEIMASFGCASFQGYHLARPMPLDEFLTLVAEGRSTGS